MVQEIVTLEEEISDASMPDIIIKTPPTDEPVLMLVVGSTTGAGAGAGTATGTGDGTGAGDGVGDGVGTGTGTGVGIGAGAGAITTSTCATEAVVKTSSGVIVKLPSSSLARIR